MEDRRLLTTIDLAALVAAQGTAIFGAELGDNSGISVSSAGDVNGDSFDDLLIGAYLANASGNSKSEAGDSYVIFGAASLPATIDLANLGTLGPTVGITIFGADAYDYSGISVSSAGDVNGDGFDDLIIGASFAAASGNAKTYAGDSYVIFGAALLPATIDLADLGTLGPTVGITIFGADALDQSGQSVSRAGDVNGDGFDDLVIGAIEANASGNAKDRAGESYVIFGAASLPATIDLADLATLGPTVGITIFGADAIDRSGQSVSSAGDVNGDGFDDLIIGAYRANASGNAKSDAGESYVIFGAALLPATIDLANLGTLGPTVGITLFGADASDYSGFSISSAGDVNGDGFDDLIIGSPGADASGNAKALAGDSYVIFGKSDWSTAPTINLANLGILGPTVGITIFGADAGDLSGNSVSSAGDVNGDGFDDLIIGAPEADASGNAKTDAGDSYLIFGAALLPETIDLATLGTAGITLFGADANDQSGRSVSNAGDVNGDGFADFIIGAFFAGASGNLKSDAGDSYVIFGGNSFTNSILAGNLGTNMANAINGTSAAQILNGADGDDTLVGSGGADILLGGRGSDILAVSDLSFKRIVGGNGIDTLRLDGSGHSLNLINIPDNRIVDIETIDITGSGNNMLTLNQREVLNISDESNTLIVRRNAGDIVNIGPGWTQILNQAIGPNTFNVYTQGAARLLVQTTSVDSTPPTVTAIIAAGSEWSPAFIDSVDGGGTGTGNGLGYALTSNLTLPNSGINRLYVQFSEPVVGFNASRLQLLGVNVANYSTAPGFLTVSYDTTNFRGIIQFATPITKDKLRIGVSDAVTDVASIALDGDENALAGGVFNFRFNILVGDANNDGSVNGGDLPFFANSFNKSVGAVGFNPRANWNSDDSVNGGDLPLFATNFNQSLPGAEPGSLTFPPLPPQLLAVSDEDETYAPLIDDYFSVFDEEEELQLFEG